MASPPAHSARTTVPSMGCGYCVCVVLAAAGIALLVLAETRWRQRRAVDAWVAGTIGAVFCVTSIGLIAPMQRSVRDARERRRREETRPAEPWTWKTAWADHQGIQQVGRRHQGPLLFFGVAALVLSLPAMFALPRELSRGNTPLLLALAFPLVGIAILANAARDAWRRRKYGAARFVPAQIPIPLGGELAGFVIADRPVVPSGSGSVTVDCWCTTQKDGHRRTRTETALGHAERAIEPADWSTSVRESRLFVRLPLRGGAATTMNPDGSQANVYEWRLRVVTPTAGADFDAEFVLPVFQTAHATEPGELTPGNGEPKRTEEDRMEVWRAAGIREELQPDAVGRAALVMPVGAGRKLMGAPLAMAVIFGAITAVLWWSPIPSVIAVFMSIFALLPALALKSLWSGGGERVWIEPNDVCVRRGSAGIRRIPRSTIQTIELSRSVGVGTQQFYRVIARCTPRHERHFPRRVIVVEMVRGEEAANEVVGWIEERLTQAGR